MPAYPPLAVKVWGEYACFTRPEMKVALVPFDEDHVQGHSHCTSAIRGQFPSLHNAVEIEQVL